MARLNILNEPDPRLRHPTIHVQNFDQEIAQHLDNMLETMYAHEGIGLAAPQVNLRQRLVVMDVGEGPVKLVNPMIIEQSETVSVTKEGCLSVPEYYARVKRCSDVRVRYWDESGGMHEHLFSGLAGTCIQHEIDHLHGILFIDHLSSFERLLVRKKLAKLSSRVD